MRSARRLHVIEACPQPETPYRPIEYVAQRCPLKPLGTPITANPSPGELQAIMRVQSMRTHAGRRAEPLSAAESQAYLRRVERVRKRSDSAQSPPSVAASRIGSQHHPTPSPLSGLDSTKPAWGGSHHGGDGRS